MNWTAIWVTCKLASLASMALLVIGLPIAYWLTFSKWRWKFLVESVVALPLVLPPTVLGFYLLVLLGPAGLIGAPWLSITDTTLTFSFAGLVLASVIYSFPFTIQPLNVLLEMVDQLEFCEDVGPPVTLPCDWDNDLQDGLEPSQPPAAARIFTVPVSLYELEVASSPLGNVLRITLP